MLLKQGIVVAALLATAGLSWAGTGGLKPRAPIPKSPAALLRVPDDATEMSLYLGLEAVTGKAWFDDIKVTVRKPPFVPTPRLVLGPPYKGHDLPRLRGAMVSPRIDEEGFPRLPGGLG